MQLQELTNTIDQADDKFSTAIDSAQKRMLNQVLLLTKDLDVANGRILSTAKNLKLIAAIQSKLNKAVVNPEYKKAVGELVKSFDQIQQQHMDYFSKIEPAFKPDSKFNVTREIAVNNTIEQLTTAGINANVTNQLKSMIMQSITTGGSYSDLSMQLTEFLTNTDKSLGALARYAKVYTTTALNEFAGANNALFTQSFSPQWYQYTGSNIETTREWCEHMTDKEYIHISEFETVLNGDVDGHECEIYDKTGLPKGMIEGTNKDNLIVRRGGWGCRHQFYAVDERIVPEAIKLKIGNFVQSTKKDNIFVGAKNSKEVQQRLNDLGITRSKLSDFNLETQNLILQSAEAIYKKANVQLSNLGVNNRRKGVYGSYSITNKEIEFNSNELNKHQPKKLETYEDKLNKANNYIDKYRSYIGNSNYNQTQLKKALKALQESKREFEKRIENKEKPLLFNYGSNLSKEEFTKVVFYHEFGHAIKRQNNITSGVDFKFDPKKSPSEYGKTNQEEYFAEMYAKYKMEGVKDIPDDLITVFKKFE